MGDCRGILLFSFPFCSFAWVIVVSSLTLLVDDVLINLISIVPHHLCKDLNSLFVETHNIGNRLLLLLLLFLGWVLVIDLEEYETFLLETFLCFILYPTNSSTLLQDSV